jgi:hypothetical protein
MRIRKLTCFTVVKIYILEHLCHEKKANPLFILSNFNAGMKIAYIYQLDKLLIIDGGMGGVNHGICRYWM